MKRIKQGTEARDELAKGAKFLADAVAQTMGPFGSNWYIDKKNAVTNDGITIAREIVLEDEIQNRGVSAIREAGTKTVDEAGDGTSTAILLCYKIYEAASKYLSKTNVIGKKTPSEIIKQIERERVEITEKLIALSTPILTVEDLIKSATVSVEDPELGKLIAEAQWDLGKDGYLLAEESSERDSSVEKVKGIRIDNGFGTSQLVNNPEKWALEVEDCAVLLTSYTIRGAIEWAPLFKSFEAFAKSGGSQIVVVARAWTDETINYCLQNTNRAGGLKIYPVSAPYTDMTERMKDLAAVTGANFYDSENSTLDDVMTSGFGQIQRIVAKRMEAIITGKDNQATNERVALRITELEKQKEGSESDFEKKTLSQRIAQLQNGFGILKVGSSSDMERRRLFDKAEDGVNAVRAALQEGTVPGAGLAFKQIAETLDDSYLLKRPLMAVHEQIMSSAPQGFKVEEWVRDPLKVMRIALEKACLSASSLATAGGVITQATPKELDQLLKRAVQE